MTVVSMTQQDTDVLMGRLTPAMLALAKAAEPDLLDELRQQTLRTILALAEEHGLAMPKEIATREHRNEGRYALDLDFERDADLDAWAAVLGMQPYTSAGFRQAWLVGLTGPVWLGWTFVNLHSYPRDAQAVTQ